MISICIRVAVKRKTRLKSPKSNLGFSMEKHTMVNNEFFLPEGIIQLIQSFLTSKEAVRTSVVSKSWHAAWSTRSDLVFHQRDFERHRLGRDDADDTFWQFAKKPAERYAELNLRIRSLSLRIFYGEKNCSLSEKLIVRALKLGATDINFEVDWGYLMFGLEMVLPKEVLGSETLRRLSVRGCKIGLAEDRKAKCSRLESLSLKEVVYTDGDIIWDIISSCPLIENLSLSACEFEDVYTRKSCPFRPMNPFYKLKTLFLERVTIDTSFFGDFGSKFPFLKDLSVHNCDGYHGTRIGSSSIESIFGCDNVIEIASRSLESISFVQSTKLRARFDVPCIRKFMYHGTTLPSLSFKNYSRGWKSEIFVTLNRHCASWFLRLKKLLAQLSRHEICVSLEIYHFTDKSSDNGRDNGLPPFAVKDLMLYLVVPSSISSSFLKGLFWSCRPKFITLRFLPCGERRNHDFLLLLGKTMKDHGLRAVNVEVFDERPGEWRRAPPLMTLVEASISPKFRGKIRLQLR